MIDRILQNRRLPNLYGLEEIRAQAAMAHEPTAVVVKTKRSAKQPQKLLQTLLLRAC